MDNEFRVEKQGDIGIIKCARQVETEACTILGNRIKDMMKENIYKIIIDFSLTNYVSSMGWGTILGSMNAAKKGGGNIVVASMNPQVKTIYESVEFDELIKSYDTVIDAIKAFLK